MATTRGLQHVQYARAACGNCGAQAAPAGVIDVDAGITAYRPSLAACARCRRVRYCNVACQRADHARHKLLCAPLAACNAMEAEAEAARGATPLPACALSAIMASAAHLTRAVVGLERSTALKYVARFCRACFRTAGMMQPGAALHCRACLLAVCCSEACWRAYAPAHAASGSCAALRCIVEQDEFQWRCVVEDGRHEPAAFVPEERVAKYSDLLLQHKPAAASFTDAFRRSVGVPACIRFGQGWGPYLEARGAPPTDELPQGLWLHTTSALSRPLSILLALRAAHGTAWLSSASTLTVHLLGATRDFEIAHLAAYEELLHLLPALRVLNLAFIGPELQAEEAAMRDASAPLEFDALECCPSCKAKGAQRRVAIKMAAYDAVVLGCAPAPAPDLVVAFQAGFSELADDWRSSMTLVLARRWPLAVTSYAEDEARMDLDALKRFDGALPARGSMQVLLPPQANPFATLELQDDWGKMDAEGNLSCLAVDSFIARNSWMCVVRGGAPA